MSKSKEKIFENIAFLEERLNGCPISDDLPEEAKKVISEAPRVLKRIKNDLKNDLIPDSIRIDQIMEEISGAVLWACGEARGREMAKNVKKGNVGDMSLPANVRLQQRQVSFLSKYIGTDGYMSLVKEWEGEDSVQGKTVHMDPRYVENFGYWMFHDKILPGQTRRLMDIFVDGVMNELPKDEQSLLKAWQMDRPSFFKVVSIEKKKPYMVKDLLNGDELTIKDMRTSETLSQGDIFLGRSYLVDEENNLHGLLGKIDVFSQLLWDKVSPHIEEMIKRHQAQNPKMSIPEVFRALYVEIIKRLNKA